MSEQVRNIMKTLNVLSHDLDAAGWDKPAQIYFLVENEIDPVVHLAGVMPTYPPKDMQVAFDQGMRISQDVLGVVVTNEGWRHLAFDELIERNPSIVDNIRQKMAESGTEITEEFVLQNSKDYYYEHIMPTLDAPGEMPPNFRVEVRTVCAVLRDGTAIVHHHSRGKDDGNTEVLPRDMLAKATIPTSMYMFLHNVRPEPDALDPFQIVEDVKTLEALSSLPTVDKSE